MTGSILFCMDTLKINLRGFVSAIAMMTACCATAHAADAQAASQPKPAIVVLGDSLSAEYGLPRDTGWVNLLRDKLAKERFDYSVANSSISGDTTSGGRARLTAVLSRIKPAVVIVELGANDGLRGQPVGQMKINLGVIIEQSRRSGARVLLVGMKLPPNYGDEYTGSFERSFGELAKQHHVALVPFMMEGFAEKREYFQNDRIHPNADAQPLILDRVWQGLRPLLK